MVYSTSNELNNMTNPLNRPIRVELAKVLSPLHGRTVVCLANYYWFRQPVLEHLQDRFGCARVTLPLFF